MKVFDLQDDPLPFQPATHSSSLAVKNAGDHPSVEPLPDLPLRRVSLANIVEVRSSAMKRLRLLAGTAPRACMR
jgi:hypothetical protein